MPTSDPGGHHRRFSRLVRRSGPRPPLTLMLVVTVGLAISGLPATAAPDARRAPAEPSPPAVPVRKPLDLKAFDPSKANLVERTENADIYEAAGARVAVVHATTANWRDDQGEWHPVDSRLIPGEAGRFRNTSGPLDVSFSPVTGTDPLVRVGGEGWSAAFDFEHARRGRPGQVSRSTIAYRDVIDGVDLEYTVGANSLKETIVLNHHPLDGASFRFPLAVSGVEPRTDADGSIGFYNEAGERLASIPPGLAWDSSASAPADAANAPVTMRLVGSSSAWAVEVEAPTDWVNDPARVWPLYLDPTFTAGHDNDGEDAFDSSACRTCTYNNAAQFDAQFGSYVNRIGYSSYPSNEHYTYLKFDLGPLAGKQVLASELRFYTYWKKDPGNWFWVKRAEQTWEDYNVSRDDAIAHSGEKAVSNATAGAESAVNMTDWVANWVSGAWANHGVVMNTNGLDGYIRIGASEEKYNGSFTYPRLIVGYNTPPAVPNIICCPDGTTSYQAPTLAASYDDPDDPTGYVEFQISGYPVQSFTAPSGGYATYQPSSLGNATYSWRTRALDATASSNWTAWRTFTINNTAPVVDSLSPEAGVWSAAGPPLSARYFDADGENGTVDFEISGIGIVASVSAASNTVVGHTPTLPEGVYAWRAGARNAQFPTPTWSPYRIFTVDPNLTLYDNWTVPGGSAPDWSTSRWVTSSDTSGRTVDVQGNAGRIDVVSSTARATSQTAPVRDSEVWLTYQFGPDRNSGSDLRIYLRGSDASSPTSGFKNAYRLDIDSADSTIKLKKVVSGSASTIGTFEYGQIDLNRHNVRFRVEGSEIMVMMWPEGTQIPVDWNIVETDSSVTLAGGLQITHYRAGSGTGRSVLIDNLVLLNIPTGGAVPEEYGPPEGTGYNQKKIFLSPAGHPKGSNIGCDDLWENDGALAIVRETAEKLASFGYVVRVGRGDARENKNASNDWDPDLHIPIHSNAGGGDPTPSGKGTCKETAPPGGPVVMYAPGWDRNPSGDCITDSPDQERADKSQALAQRILETLRSDAPAPGGPGPHQNAVTDEEARGPCTKDTLGAEGENTWLGELRQIEPPTIPAYIEVAYHTFRGDKNYIVNEKSTIASAIRRALDDFLGNPRCSSPCPLP